MSLHLNWRSLCPSHSPKFLVKGTELSFAICGPLSRFAVYEVRSYDAERNADRQYVIRDAETVSDADLKAGKRPAIVARFDGLDEVEQFLEDKPG